MNAHEPRNQFLSTILFFFLSLEISGKKNGGRKNAENKKKMLNITIDTNERSLSRRDRRTVSKCGVERAPKRPTRAHSSLHFRNRISQNWSSCRAGRGPGPNSPVPRPAPSSVGPRPLIASTSRFPDWNFDLFRSGPGSAYSRTIRHLYLY